MDPSFLESLPEAHEDHLVDILKAFFDGVAKAVTVTDIAIEAGIAYNRLTGREA